MTVVSPAETGVADQYRAVMRNFPASVNVITAKRDTQDHGMTATAVCSVSMDPASLIISINNNTLLHDMLLETAAIAVNVLNDTQSQISNAFSGAVPPEDRFKAAEWARHSSGLYTLQTAVSVVICHRKAAVPYGTHTIFIGDVQDVPVLTSAPSLVYANGSYCGTAQLEHR